jgi:quinol monooxygenase YgiN
MNIKSLVLSALMLAASISSPTFAQQAPDPQVRLAEIDIDPTQLESYKAALKEEIDASIRAEPGVLSLYAVAEKDSPTKIRIFEIYANQEAYETHLETAHFKKYKAVTQEMVKSLKMIETVPIMLGAKGK